MRRLCRTAAWPTRGARARWCIAGWRAFPLVVAYNTQLVTAADAPKTWKDLLDRRWYVAHPDVTYPADRPKLSEIKVLTVDPEEIERRTEGVKKKFVELFGAQGG